MLFSTNSAIAFSGLLCESAMMRIAFQSSPILNLPCSALDLPVAALAIVEKPLAATKKGSVKDSLLNIAVRLAGRQGSKQRNGPTTKGEAGGGRRLARRSS